MTITPVGDADDDDITRGRAAVQTLRHKNAAHQLGIFGRYEAKVLFRVINADYGLPSAFENLDDAALASLAAAAALDAGHHAIAIQLRIECVSRDEDIATL